jgi:hypothetical protein
VGTVGLAIYNILANTYGDVGKYFGIDSYLTGSVPVDLVRYKYGGAGVAPNAEKIAYGCDFVVQGKMGKKLEAGIEVFKASGIAAKAVANATEQAGAALYMKQGYDLFGPVDSPSATQPGAPAAPTAQPNEPPF